MGNYLMLELETYFSQSYNPDSLIHIPLFCTLFHQMKLIFILNVTEMPN